MLYHSVKVEKKRDLFGRITYLPGGDVRKRKTDKNVRIVGEGNADKVQQLILAGSRKMAAGKKRSSSEQNKPHCKGNYASISQKHQVKSADHLRANNNLNSRLSEVNPSVRDEKLKCSIDIKKKRRI